MVTKQQLDDSLAALRKDLKLDIDESINILRKQIIDQLVDSNKLLQKKVGDLENKVQKLEREINSTQQYNRLNNLIISGIPAVVDHSDLKQKAIGIMNTVCHQGKSSLLFFL